MKFAIVVEHETDRFIGCVPDLPWCEYPGRTAEEAKRETIAALEFHLNGVLEDGEPLPEPSAFVDEIQIELPLELSEGLPTEYRVVVEQAPSNLCAFVPDLPGCVSVGDNLDEMRRMIKEAIEFHIEAMVEDGDPLPPQTSLVEMVEVDIPQQATVAELAD